MTVEVHSQTQSKSGVSLSEAATRHVIGYLKKTNNQGIRLSVKKTGCSGLSYVIDYVNLPEEMDLVFHF